MKKYVLFELKLLSALGFGLDTSACAGGGDKNNLAYISPKTGRAVSKEKGAPYRDKLLPLPAFIWKQAPATADDLRKGFALTAHFLTNCVADGIILRVRSQLIKALKD